MEKKIVFTINKKIIYNLLISFLLAVFCVFILNFTLIENQNYSSCWYTYNQSVCDCHDRFSCSLKALIGEVEMLIILIVTVVFWTISIINHFVKFRLQ